MASGARSHPRESPSRSSVSGIRFALSPPARRSRPTSTARCCSSTRTRHSRTGGSASGRRPTRSRSEPKEVAMIEVYLMEASIRERHANARRAAALYEVLRELEPRRASPWRDAIHRLSKAISCLRLKRHTEGTALQEGGHQVTEGDRMKWVTRERARVDRIAC